MARKLLETVIAMMANSKMEIKRDLAHLFGTKAQLTSENFILTKCTEKAFTLGPTVRNTRANGKEIECMAKASLPGQMVGSISDSTSMTASMALASFFGLTVNASVACGLLESNMVLA